MHTREMESYYKVNIVFTLSNDDILEEETAREEWLLEGTVLHRHDQLPAIVVRSRLSGEILEKHWYSWGERHQNDGPAIIRWSKDGNYKTEIWYTRDVATRDDGPNEITTHLPSGIVCSETWRKDDKIHREDGPAIVKRSVETGLVYEEQWFTNNMIHNDDAPAYIERDPNTGKVVKEEWRHYGDLHRVNGFPAVTVYDPEDGSVVTERFFRNDREHSRPTGNITPSP